MDTLAAHQSFTVIISTRLVVERSAVTGHSVVLSEAAPCAAVEHAITHHHLIYLVGISHAVALHDLYFIGAIVTNHYTVDVLATQMAAVVGVRCHGSAR